jgi:hypothetical protein
LQADGLEAAPGSQAKENEAREYDYRVFDDLAFMSFGCASLSPSATNGASLVTGIGTGKKHQKF